MTDVEAIEMRGHVAAGFFGVVAPGACAADTLAELAKRSSRAYRPVPAGDGAVYRPRVVGAGPDVLMAEVDAGFVQGERVQNIAGADIGNLVGEGLTVWTDEAARVS